MSPIEELQPFFSGRRMAIVSMHQKERVIQPLLESALKVDCFVPTDIDTDQLGTFTREIERSQNVIDTLEAKCDLVLDQGELDLAIASEGSFGSHPFQPLVQANEEIVMLKDNKHELMVIGKHLTNETNFNSGFIHNAEELERFKTEAGFPEHGVILRKDPEESTPLYKDLWGPIQLHDQFLKLLKRYGKVYAETDMRAFCNPTRMKNIAKAAENLIINLSQTCSNCKMPGFVVTEIQAGLPCAACGFPTRSTKSHIFECNHCKYIETLDFPHGKEKEQPTFCDRCNP